MISQLAVFKDIVPGYRIRALTDKEKAEKVSQMVARTREWEQGLVSVYQSYLRSLEAELKGMRLSSYQHPTNSIVSQVELSSLTLPYSACVRWRRRSLISISEPTF